MTNNRKILTASLFFTALMLFFSCQKPSKCFHSAGKQHREIRLLKPFTHVKINSLFNVYWHYDTTYKVEIECGKNLLPFIETRNAREYLIIENHNKCNWLRRYERISVHIYSPTLTDLIIVGSGDYYFVDTLVSDSFKISNWADISKIDAKIRCRWFAYSQNAGTGDTYICGQAGISYLWISGMGYLHARNLFSKYTYVTNKSTGDCYVYAQREAGAYIYKSGNIYLYGTPDIIYHEKYGTGNLYRMN